MIHFDDFDMEDMQDMRDHGRKRGNRRHKSKSEGGRTLPQTEKHGKQDKGNTLKCGTRIRFNTADTNEGRNRPGRFEVGEYTGLTCRNGDIRVDTYDGEEFSISLKKCKIEG